MTIEPFSIPERELPVTLPGRPEDAPADEVRRVLEPAQLVAAAGVLRDAGARFVTAFRADRPEPSLVWAFALRGRLVALRVPWVVEVPPDVPPDGAPAAGPPLLGEDWPAARWAQRELCERLTGVAAPDGPGAAFTRPDADRAERLLRGLDAFTLPYGPIRSGVFEAIQFVIETGGEDIPRLQVRPFFKHRGLEARMRGLMPGAAVLVAERIAGIASVAWASAFSQAVERALGIEPPPRAQRWRAVLAETERIANHLDAIAKEAETASLHVGQARFLILKEDVLRLQAAQTGSRFGRGAVAPGGVRHEGRVALDPLLQALDAFERELGRDRRLFLGTASMTDRLIGTGRLARALVEEHGAVGPLARGSGAAVDARLERPYGDYRRLGLEVVTHEEGDAMARINVRFDEIAESVRILRQAIDQLRRRDGKLRIAPPPRACGAGFGWAEAPQGELVVWV
ncbi:MAG: nickel-dependent hydrogenase large subunit, partial [Solirubrobacteraceae bacterium]